MQVVDISEKMYTDKTGKLAVYSSKGNQYIRVLINIDEKFILVEAMQNI